jgi:hypothetical protein
MLGVKPRPGCILGGMQRQGLAVALALGSAAGGGLGCGDEAAPPAERCTATAGTTVRSASLLDERGLPSVAWAWDVRGAATQTTYAYDDAGRMIEQRVDRGTADTAPDGDAEEALAVVYADGGGTAEVIASDLRAHSSSRLARYELDAHGRASRVDKLDGSGRVVETRAYRYDDAGRLVAGDDWFLRMPTPAEAHRAYTYDADGRPASMIEMVAGTTMSWRFRYEEAPGRVAATRFLEDVPSVATTCVYEHDAGGRLVRVQGGMTADRDLDIAYADDGAVAILAGDGTLHTYSAACGVRLEVPRGPAAPRAPEPTGHFVVPVVRTPY